MPSFRVLKIASVLFASVIAETITSPAPAPTNAHSKDLLRARVLLARSGSNELDNLAYCYGENSICEESNNLYNNCLSFESNADSTQWYECLCGNGFVSVRAACYWCDDAFGIPGDAGDLYSTECSSYSFTIAPIPSSILLLESIYNATYTGTLPVGVTLTQAGGSQGTSAPSTTSGTGKTSNASGIGNSVASRTSSSLSVKKTTPSVSTSTFTLNGGGGSIPTAEPTTSRNLVASQTQTQAGIGTGGAAGMKSVDGVLFGLAMLGFLVVFVF